MCSLTMAATQQFLQDSNDMNCIQEGAILNIYPQECDVTVNNILHVVDNGDDTTILPMILPAQASA